MAVTIGSARSAFGHPEAGDQGREVSTQAWYLHTKGWRVFRARDARMRGRIAEAMRAACTNQLIGYSQERRQTLWQAVQGKGYDPARCASACCTDCSALVRLCVCYAWGGNVIGSFTTAGEAAALMRTGLFDELTGDRYTKRDDYLMPGDILVTRTKGHTAVVLTYGLRAQGETVTIADGSWFVRSGPGSGYAPVGSVRGGSVFCASEVSADGWVHIPTGWVSPKGVVRG